MAEPMTLKEARDLCDAWGDVPMSDVHMPSLYLRRVRDAIDAHLAQPAQADVVAWLWRDDARPGLPWDVTDDEDVIVGLRRTGGHEIEPLVRAFPGRQMVPTVDVGVIREVIESHVAEAKKLTHDPESQDYLHEQADKLTRALSGEKSEPVGYDRVLWGVVANAGRLSRDRKVRWAHISDATGQGSNSSAALCRRFGFDPDEEMGGADNEPLCDLCQERPETHSDAEGIGFCDECWAEAVAAASPAPDKEG